MRRMRWPAAVVGTLLVAGCAALVERATLDLADDLEAAILDYDEPSVIASGLPAYLMILEARVQRDPGNAGTRLAVARLTGAYAGLFAESAAAERRLMGRALEHARTGACLVRPVFCGLEGKRFEQFEEDLSRLRTADIRVAYVLATTWAGWVSAFQDEIAALADLPKVEALLEWVGENDPEYDDGAVWLYLAVLNSQRPPAAGGRPALAREYYARARKISGDQNLLIRVFMADQYARLVFDRELYVELLQGVLEADPDRPGYRLTNRIAQARARELLDKTESIFD